MSERDRRNAPADREAAPRGRNVDDAIDRAVREMMSVDAAPAFRARTLARLEHPGSRTIAWRRVAFAGASTMAVLLAAFIVTRPPAPPGVETPGRPSPSSRPPSPAQQTAAPSTNDVHEAAVRGPRHDDARRVFARNDVTREVPVGSVVAAMAEADEASAIAPLDIEPVSVAPLESASIAPAAIAIVPLTPITEVQIAPLDPRVERD
jgi:hypothetical protein